MAKKAIVKASEPMPPANIVDFFFPMKADAEPGIAKISKALRRQGIATSHLCQAMAIIIGIMSSKLGDPVPMIITEDDGAGALELLHACLNVVPEDTWIETPTGKAAKTGTMDFSGKTIVCYEADSSKDLLMQVLSETELLGKFVRTGKQSSVKPTSFVAVTKNPNHPLWQNRYVTRIHINSDYESKETRLKSLVNRSGLERQQEHKIESACLRTLLSRIKANPVDVDFADKVIYEDAAKFQNAVPFIDSMLRIIRNIARFNNMPQVRPEELQAAFINLDIDDLMPSDPARDDQPFKATKADYAYFLMIFGSTFKVSNDFLSPRQLAIYNAIFIKNIEYMSKFIKHKNSTSQQILDDYEESSFSRGFAMREDIVAGLPEDEEKFSSSTLHKELQVLLKADLIRRIKVPRKSNKFAYVATKAIGDEIPLEVDFSKIKEPEFSKQTTEIYDIIEDRTMKI